MMCITRRSCVPVLLVCAMVAGICHESLAAVISVRTREEYRAVYSPIVFEALSIGDDLAGVTWEFDDGTKISGPFAEHRFHDPGQHLVLLKTIDYLGHLYYDIQELTVGPRPVGVDLRVVGLSVADESPSGNGDGLFSPGEWASVSFKVRNFGTRPASGVEAALVLTADVKKVLPEQYHFQEIQIGDVGPLQTVTTEQALEFSLPDPFIKPEDFQEFWFYLLLEDTDEHRSLVACSLPLDATAVQTYQVPFRIEGLISPDHRDGTVWFEWPQAGKLRVSVSNGASPLDPYASVCLPSGRWISDRDGGQGDDALIIIPDAPPGWYRLTIAGEGGAVGGYVAWVGAVAENAEIRFGQQVTGQIGSVGEEHTYVVHATEGQRIEAVVTAETGLLDPFLVLHQPDGTELVDDDSGPADGALIELAEAPVTGDYTLIVKSSPDSDANGTFRLVLVEQDDFEEIQLGKTRDGEIWHPRHSVLYKFSNPERRSLRFLLDDIGPLGGEGTLDPFLQLLTLNSQRVKNGYDDNSGLGDNAILVTQMSEGFVEVSGANDTAGRYQLRMEEGDSRWPALGRGTTGTYVFAGEPEVFEVSVYQGSSMYIAVTDRGGSLDPVLRVIEPNRKQLLLVDDSFPPPEDDAHTFFIAPQTGVYRIEVSGGGETFGRAWITFELLDEGPSTPPE